MHRVVTAETLDRLPPDDPAALRSRRDLVRVHQAMGTRGIVRRAWQAMFTARSSTAPLRILELGAGDGSLLLGVASSLAPRWPSVQLTLLDQQDIVSPATRQGFEALGWIVRVQRADVLAWAADRDDGALRWDLISTSLFLHHFETALLQQLLVAAAARCDRFFACEPERSWLALAGSHLVGALGANAVTREDAVLSVRAGFRADELSARWPRGDQRWHLQESPAGLFSHCFSARRVGLDR